MEARVNAMTSRLRWRATSRYVIVAAATIAAMAAVVATPAAASAADARYSSLGALGVRADRAVLDGRQTRVRIRARRSVSVTIALVRRGKTVRAWRATRVKAGTTELSRSTRAQGRDLRLRVTVTRGGRRGRQSLAVVLVVRAPRPPAPTPASPQPAPAAPQPAPQLGIALSSASVAENAPAGTVVGALSNVDPSAGARTFSLVGGDGSQDNELFRVAGAQLRTDAVFDFEARSSYSIRVRATGADGSVVEQPLVIAVTNVDEAPTRIDVSQTSVAENTPVTTLVGELSVDFDAGDTATFALVPGGGSQDNGAFRIVGTRLETSAAFDFEARASYAIRVRGTDGAGAAIERALVITVTNVNEAPSQIALSNASVAEGQPAPTILGALSHVDPDTGDTATFSLVPGVGAQDNGDFRVVGSVLTTNAVLDAGTRPNATIRVRATDAGGLRFERTLVIVIVPTTATPVASVSFDDGLQSQFANARPVLVRSGIPATFYVIGEGFGFGGQYMNAGAVRQLAAEGNEIGNHTQTHPNLATLTAAQIGAEFQSAQSSIATAVGAAPTTCAYPFGAHNDVVVVEAAKRFAACRTTAGGLNFPATLQPHRLVGYNVTNATTANDIRSAIFNVTGNDAWIIFTYHGVLTDGTGLPGDSGDVTVASFAAHMDAIRESGITVRTVAAALASLGT